MAIFLVAKSARADPVALRQPAEGRSLSAVLGFPQASLAFRFDNGVGIAVSARFPLTALSLDAGYHRLLAGEELGWSCAATVWSGFTVTTLQAALALDLGVAIHARLHHEWFVMQLGLTSPTTLRLTGGFLARIPVLMDVWLGVQISRVTFGVQGSFGAAFVNDAPPVPSVQGAAFIGVTI